MAAAPRVRGESGETLIEAVVALGIFSVAFLAIIGGIFTTTAVADRHRKAATAETILRQFAETQLNAGYVNCTVAPATTVVVGAYTERVERIRYWNGSQFTDICPTPDLGLQLLTLRVASADSRAEESVDVVRRRTP